jgi:hypothetical protein
MRLGLFQIIKDVISLAFKVEGIDEFLAPPREIDRHSKAYVDPL